MMITMQLEPTWKVSDIPFLSADHPMVMAHRGNSSGAPENTMAAFLEAATLEVDCLETDVRMTVDGELVFFHDAKVDRTTDGHGRIARLSLIELQRLDAGHGFKDASGNHPFRNQGHQVVTVRDALMALPHMKFNMDIKSRDPSAPRLLAGLLEELDATGRVMVGSFWQKQINRFRHISDAPTSAGIFDVLRFRRFARRHARGDALTDTPLNQREVFGKTLPYAALQIPERMGPITILHGETFVQFARAVNIAVHVWTVNERVNMARLLNIGVDGIFTDVPRVLLEIINRPNWHWYKEDNDKFT
ncbi:hypothetical protein GF325_15565 [Candidatus Bathyarchaeota archaeon]|nr:hypothetical protein [Candidatus Bathyarchaeota archaeon]